MSARSTRRKPLKARDLIWMPLHALTFAIYWVIEAIMGLLPLGLARGIGEALGYVFYLLAPGYRRLVRRNLRTAFQGEKSEPEIRALTKRHLVTLGGNFFASMKISLMPTAKVEALVSYEGQEHLETAAAVKKGVIGALAHLGTWEIMSQIPSMGVGVARSTLYAPLANPILNAHIVRRRAKTGVKLFDKRSGFYGPLAHLRQGGGVGILLDQHAGDRGIWCPFFGRLASTTNLPALLSIKTGAPIVSIAVLPNPNRRGHFIIAYSPPVFPPDADKNAAVKTVTGRLNQHLENHIRRAPEQWFWVHERWKTPKPKLLLADYRRGLHVPEDASLKAFRIIVRSPNPLGDACMAIPAVRAIKRGRPDLQLTILCRENVAPIWKQVADVDAVIGVPRSMKAAEVGKFVRAEHGYFDAGVLLPNSFSSARELHAAGVGQLIGYRGHWRSWLLDDVVEKIVEHGPPRHHAFFYLHLAKHIGAATEDPGLFDTGTANPIPVASADLRIGICPGAEYGPAKRWPVERYAETAQRLYYETGGAELRLFGSPGEVEIGEQLVALLGDTPCNNRVGKTTVTELIEELKTCHLLITNDTGTMHLAGILGVPTVSIFGSTEPRWTSAIGAPENHRILRKHVECTPCFLRECPLDFRCMKAIEVDAVVEAAQEMVETPL